MRLKGGQTYWSRSGRPLYCDGMIVQTNNPKHVGMYRMTDLLSSERFLAHRNGIATDKRHDLDVTTILHPIMAIEMVAAQKKVT